MIGSGCREEEWCVEVAAEAQTLYRSALLRARLRRWWSALTRRPRSLLTLEQPESGEKVRAFYPVGVCSVPIRKIRGSESRSDDFDADFGPIQQRTRARWIRIASAASMGVVMPPVQLLQVDDVYYVRDGHHRISVARAMGQEFVEAEVMVWEVGAQPLCSQSAAVSTPTVKTPRAEEPMSCQR